MSGATTLQSKDKDYYLNYLKQENQQNSEETNDMAAMDDTDNHSHSSNDSSFVPQEEFHQPSVEDSRDISADAILPPPAYLKMAAQSGDDSDESVVQLDKESEVEVLEDVETIDEDKVDVDLNDIELDTLEMDTTMDSEQLHEDGSNKLSRLRAAAGGAYLNMDATGKVVQSFGFLKRTSSQDSQNSYHSHQYSTDDNESIHSLPRTHLPPPSDGSNSARSLLLNDEEDENATNTSAFLLPPPDANDYAPAECLSPLQASNHNPNFNINQELANLQFSQVDHDMLAKAKASAFDNTIAAMDKENTANMEQPKANANTKANAKAESTPSKSNHRSFFDEDDELLKPIQITTDNDTDHDVMNSSIDAPAPTTTIQDELVQRRLEEEEVAAKLTATVESPPPAQLPPDHYSHLLQAYEFETDPSRILPTPQPLPPKEFVQSPTDEMSTRNANDQSPNTSYEDDIELQQPEEASKDRRKEKTTRIRPGVRAGLFTIFSPRNTKGQDGKPNKDEKGTPDTDALSPLPVDPVTGNPHDLAGRQLFNYPNANAANHPSFDEGYEGSNEDCSALTGGVSKSHKKYSNNRRRKAWYIGVGLLTLVLGAAVATIAVTMYLKSKDMDASSASSSEAVIDIAGTDEPDRKSPDEDGAIVIAVTNETTSNVTQGDFEWVTTTAPFNASSLRPVTIKTPTASPTDMPTDAPTLTKNPTGTPTKNPTPNPTPMPTTQAPVMTFPPTSEGDFVGRLQALLQSKGYRDPTKPADQPFVFDFSTNESLTDPNNLALIYLAKEFAAVLGIPDDPDAAPQVVQEQQGPELGNVVVLIGDATLPPTTDPDFYPILLKNYNDEKLLQRFALLTLQYSASTSDTFNAVAGRDPATTAEPMKRIVFPGNALAQAQASSAASSSSSSTSAAAANTDPASLADPEDARFLVDECDWDGITCVQTADGSSRVATQLRWDYLQLDGSIAPTLGLLKNLTHLDMSNNQLVGSIPESLYDLTNLEEVYLFKNQLGGTLSTRIGQLDKLRRWHLSHNALSGSLPAELKSDGGSELGIRPIEYFNVYSNQLTGSIPNELRWRQCVTLDLGRNQLTGTLPEDLGDKFIALRHLFLNHNAFSGTFPSNYNTVGNGRLTALAIESNQLTGVVPGDRELYDTLVQYTLQDNQFTRLEPENCDNYYLVEFKADCEPNVCTCYGRFFRFCERWCNTRRPANWQQQQRPNQWQQPINERNGSF